MASESKAQGGTRPPPRDVSRPSPSAPGNGLSPILAEWMRPTGAQCFRWYKDTRKGQITGSSDVYVALRSYLLLVCTPVAKTSVLSRFDFPPCSHSRPHCATSTLYVPPLPAPSTEESQYPPRGRGLECGWAPFAARSLRHATSECGRNPRAPEKLAGQLFHARTSLAVCSALHGADHPARAATVCAATTQKGAASRLRAGTDDRLFTIRIGDRGSASLRVFCRDSACAPLMPRPWESSAIPRTHTRTPCHGVQCALRDWARAVRTVRPRRRPSGRRVWARAARRIKCSLGGIVSPLAAGAAAETRAGARAAIRPRTRTGPSRRARRVVSPCDALRQAGRAPQWPRADEDHDGLICGVTGDNASARTRDAHQRSKACGPASSRARRPALLCQRGVTGGGIARDRRGSVHHRCARHARRAVASSRRRTVCGPNSAGWTHASRITQQPVYLRNRYACGASPSRAAHGRVRWIDACRTRGAAEGSLLCLRWTCWPVRTGSRLNC
ncbi:hypothetical protein WOLCODRAFT_150229 [Wolfiporia cocos MD-104 SS10]|uniref:Uncharacterized protein n=1 Tax=Wolfiporia cocos (strain MD-104) TaxID=742152 RepID=A0A2H3JN06_WOLCO|nr:hypothetical protein WOLCODRAFT_150229 [Wolfiporia cocos MD-104 SS10]